MKKPTTGKHIGQSHAIRPAVGMREEIEITITEIEMLPKDKMALVSLSNDDHFLVPRDWMFLVNENKLRVGMKAEAWTRSRLTNTAVYKVIGEDGCSVGAVNIFIGTR